MKIRTVSCFSKQNFYIRRKSFLWRKYVWLHNFFKKVNILSKKCGIKTKGLKQFEAKTE